jgi:uncharacterized repeat protein (TIGR01451 family)
MRQKRVPGFAFLLVLALAVLPAAAVPPEWAAGPAIPPSPQAERAALSPQAIIPHNLDLTPIWSSPEEDSSYALAWGDWDNDGDLDLAVGNNISPNRVYENEGGNLALAWSSTEEENTLSVAWGDWDNDGDLDLAVGNSSQSNRVYENTGGTLSLAWSSLAEEYTHAVSWGDWDNDGDLDLAVGNYGQANHVYANEGGNLVLAWTSVEEDDTSSVAWGDWNNDGDLDLAAGNSGQPNQVYRNAGGALILDWTSVEEDNTRSIAWGDWNGDGLLDLVVGNYGDPFRVYSNHVGDLSLAWSSDEQENTAISVDWGDWDGDGDLDLAIGNNIDPDRVYENVGGDLLLAWSSPEKEVGEGTHVVAWGDWNNDGDLDLAVGCWGGPTYIYENLAGPMAREATISFGEDGLSLAVAWGDWDNDGDLDLAEGTSDGLPCRVYQNDEGVFSLAWSSVEDGHMPDVAWGDWDNDGDLDLALGLDDGQDIVYENTGGDLTLAWTADEVESTFSVDWGDWDGDGDLDLAVGNWNSYNYVYENTGGDLVLTWTAAEYVGTTSVAWGDWDGDGDLDLAVGNTSGQANQLYENQGGTLSLAWASTETANTEDLAWGDWDGDGDLDLAVGNVNEPNQVYENQAGNLVLAWSSAESDSTSDLAWADWDGDGDLDLASANVNHPSRVHENEGAGLATVAVWSSIEQAHNSLAWGDYDQDSDLDLVFGDWNLSVWLYQNNRVASPVLPNQSPHVVVSRPGSSAEADFYGTAEILTGAQVPIRYRLYDAQGDHVPRIVARYSMDGGGQWLPATVSGATTNLSASPQGELHLLWWNALADGAAGDNVRFRLISVLDDPTYVATPIQRPYVSGETLPFRLRPLAVSLLPLRQLGIGSAGEVLTHTLTLFNRTGRDGLFALSYDSFRGWPVDGPNLVGPISDQDSVTFVVSTTIPAGPVGILDIVTATAAALFNPSTFQASAHIFTYRGAPSVTMSLSKGASVTIAAGTVMSYTLVAQNAGPSPAGGMVIQDVLPAEVEFAWASDEGVFSPTLGAVLWPEIVLMSGQSMTVTVAVTANCSPSGTMILNDDYSVDCDQCAEPVAGLPVTTTVLYDAPVAAFSLGKMTVTAGVPLTLTNDSTDATAYLWSFGDGDTATLFQPMHSYTVAGTYTVTLVASNLCGSDQVSAVVTVVERVVEYKIHLPVVMKRYQAQ